MNTEGEAVVRALAATPIRLKKVSRGATEDTLDARPSAKEWSAREIVNHLRANADVWGSTIRRMVDDDYPTIRYVSPRSVMKNARYSECRFDDALKFFVGERKKLVARLNPLSPEEWLRGASFTGISKRRSQETVLDYARRMAAHEAEHIAQFEALFT